MLKKIGVVTQCLLLMASFSWAADVKSTDPLKKKPAFKRWYFSLGPYGANLDTGINLGLQGVGLGIELDVEEFFGLETSSLTFRIDGYYRAGRTGRHKIAGSWFAFYREGENTLLEEVTLPPALGGGTIPLGTTVEGKFNIDIFKLTYRYSIILDDRIDLNVGGGLYIAPIELGFGVKGSNFESSTLTAPLPVVGAGLKVALTPRWFVMTQADLMYLEISGYEGSIINSLVGLEYRPFKKVGFGIRGESLNLKVETTEDTGIPGLGDFVGTVDFAYTGASIYLSVFF